LIHEVAISPETSLRTLLFAYTTSRIWRNQDYERAAGPGKQYERVVGDPRIPNGGIFFEDSTIIPDRTFDVAGIEPRLEHRFSTAGIGHVLHLGTRFLGETAQRASRRGETKLSYAGGLESYETSRTYAFAVYLQDKIAFTDFLVATPGVRFESAHQQRHIQRAFVDGQPRDVALKGSSAITEAIPGIGAILGSKPNHAFGGVHVGFAPPRLTSAIDSSGVDAQLDAERSINYEAGARTTPLRWLRFELTGFLSSYRNQVIPAPSGEGRLELKNAGETRHSGAETAARAAIGEALRLPLTIDLSGQYTLSHAVFGGGDSEGNTLPYAPLHTAGGALDIEHRLGLGGQLALTYVGEQFSDEENTVQEDAAGRIGLIEDRAVVDLAARYRHARTGLTASVSVKNLFDAAYVASRRPDGIFPGSFRQVFFGLRWDWVLEPAPRPDDEAPAP
jgi:Fe(3+) dicitrate transport protein